MHAPNALTRSADRGSHLEAPGREGRSADKLIPGQRSAEKALSVRMER